MPEIPQLPVKEQASYIPNRAQASPSALAAPGLATERLGAQVAGLGDVLGKLQQFQDVQYTSEHSAAATTKWHDALNDGIDEARQSGDYQGFARNLRTQLDQDLQQRIDNAPSSAASAHLKRQFANLTEQVSRRASIFEHGMAVQDSQAKRLTDVEDTAKGLYRDPTRLFDEHARVAGAIGGAQSAGLLNPQQAEKEKQRAGDTLTTAAILGRLEHDPAGAAADFTTGKYDPFLSVEALERLKPKISDAKAHAAGDRAWSRIAPGGSAVSSRAINEDIPPEGRALLDSIAGPESGGAYNVRYTPQGGAPFADLSKHPRIPEPGSQGPSTAAGRYQITGQTYDDFAPGLGIADFGPKNQDTLGWTIAQDAYKKQTGGDLLTALKEGKLSEVQDALRKSHRWDTANLSTYAQNLGKYQDRGMPVPGAATSAAGPDLDQGIANVQRMVDAHDLTPQEGDKAIATVTRRYHEWHQATAQERAQLLNDTQNAVAMLASGRDATIDTTAIRRLLPREKADELLRAADEARDFGNAKNRVDAATPGELIDLQAKAHGALTDPTDFARKQRYTKALDAALDQRQKALDPNSGDPAAYAMMVAPAVQAAWKAVDAQGAGNEAAVQATLAEQERLGVPSENRRALTKAQAGAIVAQIANTDPEKMDMGAALAQAAQSYGAAWPKVFGDLVKSGLPREAQLLGAMDMPDQATARTDYQRMLQLVAQKGGSDQLRKAAPHDQVQAIDQGIDSRLAEFRATVRDPRLYDAVKSGLAHLAYYYAFKGQSGDQALASAYDGMIARKYDIDAGLRTPKGMLGTVERAGDVLVNQIAADQLPDLGGNAALTAEQRRAVYLSAIKNGRWVTSEDDSGAVRTAKFRDGSELPAKRADGSRIEFKFGDAAALAGGRPASAAPYQGPF